MGSTTPVGTTLLTSACQLSTTQCRCLARQSRHHKAGNSKEHLDSSKVLQIKMCHVARHVLKTYVHCRAARQYCQLRQHSTGITQHGTSQAKMGVSNVLTKHARLRVHSCCQLAAANQTSNWSKPASMHAVWLQSHTETCSLFLLIRQACKATSQSSIKQIKSVQQKRHQETTCR